MNRVLSHRIVDAATSVVPDWMAIRDLEVDLQALSARGSGVHAGCITSSQPQTAHD